ncbi:glycerol kinase [Leptolyngbya boryana NIES-2135]|jgi:glycerol kinase|uniref:Glycerol kinase n=1 Tax=Leptolyngbya boryana NIES-2135 TaxID=1973484 RepID=A0A1Z4J9F7_LEPBY|nr:MULTISPECIES: glycerol kinase GlpK [Leptolyngbya]BAY53394.1 glycerol kinase [Leptolyngbya boryana NIES-2135]MBD2366743.1 glycerol kinase GlpK [Leptolyngbya sp. FACHB-161]MBD2373243.1 glycerol kinase GlpK [Leptolyngbya sp. FACHB-238]MBD2397643.1 glycerol kinase GlpK [Leptolyngbya sp. FACHB-239]MBD2404787.1 glycerol kinase GlpK [Leptolyngbya sp. FACHB-402]
MSYILALDLGTTGNRAFLFDQAVNIAGQAYQELTQYYPQPGWVEHDAEEIWNATRSLIESVGNDQVKAIGLTVQRETCLLWDKTTGKPLHRAIVWQDRRTAPFCNELRDRGLEGEIYDRTGLVLDAYFSATKLRWLLDQVKGVDLNNVLAGTIDSWILWNLTDGKVHATDHSNASRTLLMNLKTGQWDQTLLDLFGIPLHMLPSIQPSLSHFGDYAGIPITAILGDQQAALFGQGCDRPGLMKCTYGTGTFLVAHTGSEIVRTDQQLISTIAWTDSDQVGYAIEGSMFTSGACVQWLRDELKMISTAQETAAIAASVPDNGGVYFVPALSGLGTPHWDMSARGAFLGITRGANREHLVRSVLEAIAFQVKEVIDEIEKYSPTPIQKLAVDGGACENDFLMQFQADVLGIAIERPAIRDTTVQGAAFAAGLSAGIWESYDQLVDRRIIDRVFEPSGSDRIQAEFKTWQKAVDRVKRWE